jgi:hypothetical protein
MGILEDADLDTEQFGTLSLLFYVAFLAFEFPHAYLMQRLPTAKYLGSMVCCWGVVVACTSACNNYGSLVATRFLLGAFESAISPSLILITSMWYRRHEQPKRVGFWYIGVGTAGMVGALMSYGFQFYEGTRFSSWQIMFLVVGCITVFVGAIVIIFMPDNPMSAKKLTHAERVAAVERLRENQTGVENKVSPSHPPPTPRTLVCVNADAAIALQTLPTPPNLQRPPNLAPSFHHNRGQHPQRRRRQLPIPHHQRPRLQRQTNRTPANPRRRNRRHKRAARNLDRRKVQRPRPQHHRLVPDRRHFRWEFAGLPARRRERRQDGR